MSKASVSIPPADLVTVDRDSVSAGDDAEPHRTLFALPPAASVSDLLVAARRACPLASIAGGCATWLVDIGTPARCIGVIAQHWPAARLVVPDGPAGALFGDGPRLVYFRYWLQSDPEAVFDALLRGVPLPDRYAHRG